MTLQLFAHPFSSYCWKVLIALWENDTPFEYRPLDQDRADNGSEWATLWPLRKMPVLVDDGRAILETSVIIEHLDLFHPGATRFIPTDPATAIEVRMLDRIFDNYVMTPMTKHVTDAMRGENAKDPAGVADAGVMLDTVYSWLDARLAGRRWAAGDMFSLADCAGAPALFYADWVRPIPAKLATLRAYRKHVLAHPAVSRAVEEARPYRAYFPLGAPDRD